MSHPSRSNIARRLSCALVFAWFSCAVCGIRGETPTAADFPVLGNACRPLDKFLSGTAILVGQDGKTGAPAAGPSGVLFPASAPILAFEENSRFLCAVGQIPQTASNSPTPQGRAAEPAVVRRLIVLKPSVFVVDDLVNHDAADTPVKWQIHCRTEPTMETSAFRLTADGQRLSCRTAWPRTGTFKKVPGTPPSTGPSIETELPTGDTVQTSRCQHYLQLHSVLNTVPDWTTAVATGSDDFSLTVKMPEGDFDLELPPPGTAAGRVSLRNADGKTIIPRRPLPAGILPHGPEGMRLIERWDSRYRDGRVPGWDTGVPAPALEKAVDDGDVRPCRTVVLGCGSGTNAIYLAKKGFDVTAIDVAPTALAIAQEKTDKAGVEVRWMLADVLAPPELEPFDFIFDRGCYHNVRYVDAAGFLNSVKRLSKPGTKFLVLSLNRDGPPGVREQTMRDDFTPTFDFLWLREGGIRTGQSGQTLRQSWSLMLKRKSEQ